MKAPGDAATTRARIPVLSERHVARPRLTRLLDAATGQAIVAVAPAGYGKTALIAEWLQSKPRAAWLNASASAADLAACSTTLAEAATAVVPGAGQRLRARLRVGETPEQAARPLAELLAEDLAGWPADAWLAVDDYHLLADSGPVEEFFDWLLTLAPVKLVVTSRRRPAWVSARRVLYGEITEIGRDDLAMTEAEVSRVLSGSGDAVSARVERAHGWPAVVGLAAISTSRALPNARVADTLFRYLAEEVFRSEPPEVQRFMLAAAVPAAIETSPAGDLLGVPGAADAVVRLRAEGLLHDSGAAVAFHPLLREFLLRKLDAEEPGWRVALYDRAIEDARRAGRWEEGFDLAIASDRSETAAEIMSAAVGRLLDWGRIETVERWLAACGPVALQHAELVLARAEVLIRRGELFEASALADEFARRLPAGDPHLSAAWYLAGRAFHLLSEDERALECHLKASEAAANPHDLTNALWGATVLAAQLESDVIDRLVEQMEDVAAADLDGRLQLASGHAFLASRRRTLAGVWTQIEPLVHVADQATDPMAQNSFLIAAAYVNISRARYRLGRELADRAVETCEHYRLGRIKSAFCLCYRVAADIGLRRFGRAEQTLDEISRLGIDHTRVIVAELRNLQAKLLLAKGDPDQVLVGEARAEGGPGAAVGEYAGLVALAAAAVGDIARSRAAVRRARGATRSIEAEFYSRYATLVSRLAADASAERVHREASQLLADTAEAEMLDAFVLAYRAHPPLLSVLVDQPAAELVRAVVREARDEQLARRAGIAIGDGRLASEPELLTPREREVLELLSEGLANAEIARRLFISEKTAKVHLYHIFEKLGVKTRVQAVLAARDLLAPQT
jgi:LuxR family maltose regulon positive regulatory protein